LYTINNNTNKYNKETQLRNKDFSKNILTIKLQKLNKLTKLKLNI